MDVNLTASWGYWDGKTGSTAQERALIRDDRAIPTMSGRADSPCPSGGPTPPAVRK